MKDWLQQNVGSVDRWSRFSLGFVLVFLAGAGIVGPWAYLGVVPMLSAMVGYCPLYHVLGISTCAHRR